MAKKKIETPIEFKENIILTPLEEIMGERYATYAKYVIQDRAIPDVRDGLKPVQRRIIYAMYHSGNLFRKAFRKCASSVGEVMGRYHPHGDASIYEALAHMSQPWKYRAPLIDFQGNNGSIDGDNPAAHRYTEARLSELAEELVRDIDKDTVDMQMTFDDSQLEPTVLPARFPNLLVNGTQGIAVALATNIPPHNLGEVIEAAIYRLGHPKAEISDLMQFVKGPDFPTGASILTGEGMDAIYLTGRGRVEIVSTTEIVPQKEMTQIIVTEIPFGVVKSKLVRDIDEIRYRKVVDGIIEVRDESDHEGLRIAIDLKKEANSEIILSFLLTKTDLKSAFNANMVAIVAGHPLTLNLLQFIDAYLDHQVEVITRLSRFNLAKASDRLHLVNGLIKAISILDQVVAVIRKSTDKADAISNLVASFDFSLKQAEAIVMLQLYKLTNTDVTVLIAEATLLEKDISILTGLLDDRKKLDRQLISDLKAISLKYGTPRKTAVINEAMPSKVIDKRDLISKDDVMVALTRDGYIKRSSMKSFKSSDGSAPGLKENDLLVSAAACTTLDYLLAFTNLGNYLFIPVHEIHENKWKEEGKHINYLVTLTGEEKILTALRVTSFREDIFIAIVTRNGQIKRTSLSEFLVLRFTRPIGCMRLLRDDEVVDVVPTSGNTNLMVVTSHGNATMFNENELSPVGIKAGGVKAINSLKSNDKVTNLIGYEPEEKGKLILVTDGGHLRVVDSSYVAVTARLGKIQYVYKNFKSDPHELRFMRKIAKNEQKLKMTFLLSDHSILVSESDDLRPTPIDKYAKKNLTIPRGLEIIGGFKEDLLLIDENTVSYKVIPTEKVTTEKAASFEQISIFEDMGD